MTKVLIISNKSDLTSDFIIKELRERKIDFYRFNTEELTKSVSISIDIKTNSYNLFDSKRNQIVDLKKITSVYYRRPELPIIDPQDLTIGEISFLKNEILFTLEGVYKILKDAYWISPVYAIREAENKIYQLLLAKSLGFSLPNSLITNKYEILSDFLIENSNNCIIKPIKSGLIEDNENSKVVFTNKINELPSNRNQIEDCPLFFQTHIVKEGDIRVTVVGDKVFATLIHSQVFEDTEIDWRRGEKSLKHTKIDLPINVQEQCTLLLKSLGLRFGAIDFILDKSGNYVFLEINPNGQWAWIEKQTGYEISKQIVNLLIDENFA